MDTYRYAEVSEAVAQRHGGQRADIQERTEAELKRLQRQAGSAMENRGFEVLIGSLKFGVCRHRALLYKVRNIGHIIFVSEKNNYSLKIDLCGGIDVMIHTACAHCITQTTSIIQTNSLKRRIPECLISFLFRR